MTLSFDHLVHMTERPEKAVQKLQALGFHALNGGRHPNWGTYNGICHFDLSYIEWIGFDNKDIAGSVQDNTLIQQLVAEQASGEGFYRIALRTNNMAKTAAELKSRGLVCHGPVAGSRKKSDGTLLEWTMLFIEDPASPDRYNLPFIIDWQQSDQDRRAALKCQGILKQHAAQRASLERVAVAVHDLEKTLSNWENWFDLRVTQKCKNTLLQAECAEVDLEGTRLIFCTPIGPGVVKDVLHTRGERPFLAAVSGNGQKQIIEVFGATYQLNI
ncbi:glyoxalase-like protein [Scopulibacillus darangshiensis]|uniref:Glyoxalase-like protein n=1 Tax=Scopulibacillus darangshiensis TaxID=442528 RepID=A0A4R2PAW7_9BACL|nr:VOC family protein [Scopulibacillus darangshiensis]TCP31251.1 glyoxalase-like protein [Scopulibacillus darangshiensis]